MVNGNWKTATILLIVVMLFGCCSAGMGAVTITAFRLGLVRVPAISNPVSQPVVEKTPEKVTTSSVQDSFLPPDGSMPLLRADGTPKGYALVLYNPTPAKVSLPEGGWTIVTCGNCTFGGVAVKSDGTVGNVILFLGVNPDGSTPNDLNSTITGSAYTTGHVAVTTIWSTSDEDPTQAALNAVAGMFRAPACGQEGCLTVNLTTIWPDGSMEEETFTSPPAP